MRNIDSQFAISTDLNSLTIFDPVILAGHVDEREWWIMPPESSLPEVSAGVMLLLSIDLYANVRITTGQLTQDEKDFANDVIGPFGVEATSGQIYIGGAEYIPSDGNAFPESPSDEFGKLIEIEPGKYDLTLYSVNKPNTVRTKTPVADIVIVIKPRTEQFVLSARTYLDRIKKDYLYPSERSKKALIPKVGKEVEVVVYDTPRTVSNKVLKELRGSKVRWPVAYNGYDILLDDMSLVSRGDKLKVKTVRVDMDNKIIYAELIEKIG